MSTKLAPAGQAKNDIKFAPRYLKDYHMEEGFELLSPQGMEMGP